MHKTEIAAKFTEIAGLLEILGENPFKIRAHLNAARVLETTNEDIASLASEGNLTSIKGIGKGIAEKITTILQTGDLPELKTLHEKVPSGVLDMLKIPGLGPKRVKAVWANLGVTTLGELEYACNENRLATLEGFGTKTEEKVLKGIATFHQFAGRWLLSEAIKHAETALAWVQKHDDVKRAMIGGSIRRGKETVRDVDIIASSAKPLEVMEHFASAPFVSKVLAQSLAKTSIRFENGLQADLRVVADSEFPFTLCRFTGSHEHNNAIRVFAESRGMQINEHALLKDKKPLPCKDETAIFKALGLSYIPPELREGLSEIETARSGNVFDLIEYSDLEGLFHCHTKYSDGRETVETMVMACKELGFKYLGISDHSRSASYAGGLSIDDLKKQGDEIDKLNDKLDGFRIFKGVESDILGDGALDYPNEVLEQFDFVIASVHSGLGMDEKKITARIIRAIENPYTTMLGHPTGRLLLSREPCAVSMHKVIDACAKNSVIIEINANPHRLDIDWRLLQYAKSAGVMLSINPDAHRIAGLEHAKYGVMIARKGGLAKADVLNTMSLADVTRELAVRKKTGADQP